MPAIALTIHTDATRSVVWDELRHIDRHVEWMLDAVSITFATDQREGVGTSFRCRTKIGPLVTNDEMTITEWVDGSVMRVRHEGVITGEGQFTLHDVDGGTTIRWTEQLVFPWWALGPIGAFVASPILRAMWRGNLKRLAARC